MDPHECTVSWEPPAFGGPVQGYKVVARPDGKLSKVLLFEYVYIFHPLYRLSHYFLSLKLERSHRTVVSMCYKFFSS